MSPFYRKEGNNWIPLESLSPDIKVGKGRDDKAHVFLNSEDKEQITVYVSGSVIVREEDGDVIFPEQGRGFPINRRDVIFENVATGDRAIIIHSEKSIGVE